MILLFKTVLCLVETIVKPTETSKKINFLRKKKSQSKYKNFKKNYTFT